MAAASRGSRVHHMRRSSNPFMTTSSGIVGINLEQPVEFLAPKLDQERNDNNAVHGDGGIVKFMYQTSATAYGDGIERRECPMSQKMDKPSVKKG